MPEMSMKEREQALHDTGAYYRHTCWMAVPLLCMSAYLYGLRPVVLCMGAFLIGNFCDRLVAFLRRRVYQPSDYSSESFALIIALLLPATVSWYVMAVAVVAGVLIGKEAFGGYGSYPFHPAAVGYVVAAVSWPEQMFRYPLPYTEIPLWDASSVAVTSGISDTLRNGGLPNLDPFSLLLGEFASPMGTGCCLIILACGLFLWRQKDIRLSAAFSFVAACALVAFFFPRQADLVNTPFWENVLPRLNVVKYELLSGAMLFTAVFLLNEPYTCPHRRIGRIAYGALVGLVSMSFRYFGVYTTGACFAILAVNSIAGWLDRAEARLYALDDQFHWIPWLHKSEKGGDAA